MATQNATTTEVWRPIPGYEGLYAVSNLGKVCRACPGKNTWEGRILKPKIDRCGYLYISLFSRKQRHFRIHTLVASAFLGCRLPKQEINHKNGIKTDNRPENLEYCTGKQNMGHAFQVLGIGRGSRNGASHFCESDILLIRKMANQDHFTAKQLAEKFRTSAGHIRQILNRRYWQHI